MKKTLLKVKYENIALLLFIPLAIIQFLKANIDYKLLSVLMSITLYGGAYLTILIARKEALIELKDEIAEPILKPVIEYLKAQKKEIIKQAIYKRPSLYIKSKF